MTFQEIIKAGCPNADEAICEHIIWGMTPYPFELSAKQLYKAASRFKRASDNGVSLCELCSNLADHDGFVCSKCHAALHQDQQI